MYGTPQKKGCIGVFQPVLQANKSNM